MNANAPWEKKNLGALCELYNGYAFKPVDWKRLGKPIIRIQNLNGGQDFNHYIGELPERYAVEPGTLLFAWSGNRGTSFGPYIWNGPDGYLNQHIFKVVTKEEVDAGWFYFALDEVREQVERNAHGASGLVHVRKEDLCKYVLLVPTDTAEQRSIATILKSMDNVIQQTGQMIEKLQQVKAGLLHDFFRYGIDQNGEVRDPLRNPKQFKASAHGLIPTSWFTERLERLTTVIVDGVHHTPTYVENGVPFLTVENLTRGAGISLYPCRYVSSEAHQQYKSRAEVRARDVLVTKDGTLGVARVVPDEFPEVSIFVSVALIRPRHEIVRSAIIREFFNTSLYESQIGSLSAGTGLKHIHLEHFRKFVLPIAPMDEQQAMEAILADVDQKLETENLTLEKMTCIKTGIMRDLLTGRVRVPEGLS